MATELAEGLLFLVWKKRNDDLGATVLQVKVAQEASDVLTSFRKL